MNHRLLLPQVVVSGVRARHPVDRSQHLQSGPGFCVRPVDHFLEVSRPEADKSISRLISKFSLSAEGAPSRWSRPAPACSDASQAASSAFGTSSQNSQRGVGRFGRCFVCANFRAELTAAHERADWVVVVWSPVMGKADQGRPRSPPTSVATSRPNPLGCPKQATSRLTTGRTERPSWLPGTNRSAKPIQSSLNMCLPVPWNMAVSLDNTTLACNSWRM